MRALVDTKANLQLANRGDRMPLVRARERGYPAMEQMLMKTGAR